MAGSAGIRKLVRFGIAGLAATVIYFLLFLAIDAATGMNPTLSSVLAYCLALIFSYFAQSRFVFLVTNDTAAQTGRFIASSALGLTISVVALEVSQTAGWPNWVGSAIVCVSIPVLNFLMMNFWVFCSNSGAERPDSGAS